MAKIKKSALSVLYSIKHRLSSWKLWLGKKLGLVRSVMIMPYQGFGNREELFFPGRVLKDRKIGISQLEDSSWQNFKKMYKRFMTWEIHLLMALQKRRSPMMKGILISGWALILIFLPDP